MSKYIDADKLLKSTIAKFKCVPLVGVPSCRNGKEYFDGENFDTLINETPTADVVEVVRCKDCRWWECEYAVGGVGRCQNPRNGLIYELTDDTDYCSYGERGQG